MASRAIKTDGPQLVVLSAPEDGGGDALMADLLDLRRRYLDALPIAAAVLYEKDGGLRVDACNQLFERIDTGAGWSPDDLIGLEPLLDRSGLAPVVSTFLAGRDAQCDLRWSDGDSISGRHFAVRISRVRTLAATEPRCLLTLLDRTAEVQTEKSLRLEMQTDSLTGLLNRSGFTERVEQAIADAAGTGQRHALLILDLRRFGRINESVGALSGDELLITAARRLLRPLRTGDVIARIGANEFGILVRTDETDGGIAVADRLRKVFEQPFRLSELEISVDCAIGSVSVEAELDVDELIRRAQFASKRAKQSGQVEQYQPVAFDRARRRFTLETDLRRAIEGDRLRLAFQPITCLATGRVLGFEALSRWPHDGGMIPPTEFIPVAEESGLIVPLGRWALDHALKTLAAWDAAAAAPQAVSMAVNLSPLQIAQDDVPSLVEHALAKHGVAPRRLIVELTESAIIADPERAMGVMAALRELGVELALDDFGTGYSNLSYLQRLPIDMLKIDRSFVTGMLTDRDKGAIVRAILSLAQAFGLRTTAEGIESPELAALLAALGCTRGQGFLYASPLDSEAAFAYLSDASA
ncbi:diguanylate cyclase (GGDEF)-like protein [Sphingomonas jejuensis]|uniref:Diguanylate cyclase (GGDEF)-like protein n=1 Tax=Sphingomonas jejuensis TaxID=904715 RepID=A0ABX0XLW0_9SPHN|nr:bifunctional diguanylate cyclase/phosphodiesterase [Sphingomonas jejuensis]NJC34349.1 diguanylate cyclase (GGDEF)-like protein [Sphingomonas jejuensis]